MSVSFFIHNGPRRTKVMEEMSCGCFDYQCFDDTCPVIHRLESGPIEWDCANFWNREIYVTLTRDHGIEDAPYKICPLCNDCYGTGRMHLTGPEWELNLSNGNFRDFADMLQIPYDEDDLCGELKGGILNTMYRNCMKLLNREDIVERTLVRETIVEDNIIHCGKSADVWLQQIEYLVKMIKMAREMDEYIYFV